MLAGIVAATRKPNSQAIDKCHAYIVKFGTIPTEIPPNIRETYATVS